MKQADESTSESLSVLHAGSWESFPGLVHGFLGRRGGRSVDPWSSLNVSDRVGDDADAVASNWEAVRRRFPGLRIARMRQVHGDRIVPIDDAGAGAGEADGMVTATAGVGLAILTADCVPILMIAPAERIAMAVHAGWRGTVAGIAARAVAEGRRLFGVDPSAWHVALGPSIGVCCYEVSSEVGVDLERRWGAMGEAWRPAGEQPRGASVKRGMLDLRMANRRILVEQGLAPERIVDVGPCTACASSDFFSHRRSGGRAGRQLSIVGWI